MPAQRAARRATVVVMFYSETEPAARVSTAASGFRTERAARRWRSPELARGEERGRRDEQLTFQKWSAGLVVRQVLPIISRVLYF